MKSTEILAPAGSITSLKGAIAAGADAVYIGGSKFGARAYADNPDEEGLLSAIDFVHLNGKKVYLTVNTLLKNKELEEGLYDYLLPYYERGLDAVIVQDFGVLDFVERNFPQLQIHASTQMTVCSGGGASFIEKHKNVSRVVPARELSLSEVRKLRQETSLELECFVHGALCYCYSGQCLFSGMIGGRSGNRGRCAQPCRQKYELFEAGKSINSGHLLSLKDICTLADIPDLVDAGIDSFKIEGRMKKPEYSAGVAAAYAFLTKKYHELGRNDYEVFTKKHPDEVLKRVKEVSELYNRGGFTKGYYFNYHGPKMMTPDRPNHSGIEVGKVSNVTGRRVSIKISEQLFSQDVLEIRGKEAFEFTVGASGLERLKESKAGIYEITVSPDFRCEKGTGVFRIRNNSLINEISEKYLLREAKAKLEGICQVKVGKPVCLRIKGLETETETFGDVIQEAGSRPMTAEDVRKVLLKTGESKFDFSEINVSCDENAFIPVGKLKELRRGAFDTFEKQLLKKFRRDTPVRNKVFESEPEDTVTENRLIVRVSNKEQLEVALDENLADVYYLDLQQEAPEEQIKCGEKVRNLGKKAYFCFPPIFRIKEKKLYDECMDFSKWDGVVVNTLDEVAYANEKNISEIRGSASLYVMNDRAKTFLKEKCNVSCFTASRELNKNELIELNKNSTVLNIYERVPLMYSAQCLRDNYGNCLKNTFKGEEKVLCLKDKTGVEFPVRTICRLCLNIIYNSSVYSMLGMDEMEELMVFPYFEIGFTTESASEVRKVLEAYREGRPLSGNYTRGHMRRGVE